MKNVVCHLFFLTAIFSATNAEIHASPRSEKAKKALQNIDPTIESWLDTMNVPGTAIAILVDGEVVLAKGFGLRNVENVQPVTTKTLFQIGSGTKSFTGFLMGQLVDEGLFDWDDHIADHIPYFKLKDPYRTYEITIRDYLTHRSGYPSHDGIWYNEMLPRPELVKRMRHVDPQLGLRERFLYQNGIGYTIASHVAELETGKPWEDLVREHIFTPLGMSQSIFSVEEMIRNSDYSNGYREKNKEVFSVDIIDPHSIAPAAAIISNLEDLTLWVKLLLKKGEGLISPDTFNEITRPQIVSDIVTRRGFGIDKYCPMEAYGIGWILSTYCNHPLVFHGGNLEGFTSSILVMPEDNVGVIVLTNKHLTPFPYIASIMLLENFIELPKIDWVQKYKAMMEYSKDGFLKDQQALGVHRYDKTDPSHALHEFLGTYYHPGYGRLEINLGKNRLEAVYNKMHLPLNHWHYDVFEVSEESNVPVLEGLKFTFSENVYGDIDALSVLFEPKVDEILFKKLKSKNLYSDDYLDKFTGDYSYHGFIFSIYREGEKLVVKAMGQPPFDLIPERNALFKVKNYDGYSVQFITESDGSVSSVQLIQPNSNVFTAHRH